jgi:hypothetical protein
MVRAMSGRVADPPRPLVHDESWRTELVCQVHSECAAGRGSGQPVTGRSSPGGPVMAVPAPRSGSPLCIARGLTSADRACCGLVNSGSAGSAGGRALAPRAPRSGHSSGAAHPAMHRASRATPRCPAPRANRARARGCNVSPVVRRVAGTRPVEARGSAAGSKGAPAPRIAEEKRRIGPLDHAPERKACGTPISRHGTERAFACSAEPRRLAHRAGHLCQHRRRPQAMDHARSPGPLSWVNCWRARESAPPLPRTAGPTEASQYGTVRSNARR